MGLGEQFYKITFVITTPDALAYWQKPLWCYFPRFFLSVPCPESFFSFVFCLTWRFPDSLISEYNWFFYRGKKCGKFSIVLPGPSGSVNNVVRDAASYEILFTFGSSKLPGWFNCSYLLNNFNFKGLACPGVWFSISFHRLTMTLQDHAWYQKRCSC